MQMGWFEAIASNIDFHKFIAWGLSGCSLSEIGWREILWCRIVALSGGLFLDLIFGDPGFLPHPVRAIGKLISALEKRLLHPSDSAAKKRRLGAFMAVLVVLVTAGVIAALLGICLYVSRLLFLLVEVWMMYRILAVKDLRVESMRVYLELTGDGTEEERLNRGRRAVSMIVGRDTEVLTREGVIKAAVETVAESTSDGITGPVFYMMAGGILLAWIYKAINTMDSMVGYKNDAYMDFGRFAAKLDDVAGFLPARLGGFQMVLSAFLLQLRYGSVYSGANAWKIFFRDRRNHASPNSAHTESACAGALGLRLAGGAVYFGTFVEKPYIGDLLREIEAEDIILANRLMYLTAILHVVCAVILLLILMP